jgi:hypothetical protein
VVVLLPPLMSLRSLPFCCCRSCCCCCCTWCTCTNSPLPLGEGMVQTDDGSRMHIPVSHHSARPSRGEGGADWHHDRVHLCFRSAAGGKGGSCPLALRQH